MHGMTVSTTDVSDPGLSGKVEQICRDIGCSEFFSPRQDHTAVTLTAFSSDDLAVFRARSGDRSLFRCEEGDAVAIGISVAREARCAIGVRTADCLPILVRGKSSWGAIHAGWRGLANGVIRSAMRAMVEHGPILSAVVFPCAGKDLYEVGNEVIEAIGKSSVAHRTPSSPPGQQKWMLDLAATAKVQLSEWVSTEQIVVSSLCTMTTKMRELTDRSEGESSPFAFHSFRRDQERSGRSLTFVDVGA